MPYPVEIPEARLFPVATPVQIRFNDIDILGHVNNTVYFSLYDTGKARFMEAACGGEIDFRNVETVIANVDCAFISPIYFGQEVEVLSRVSEMGLKHIVLEQMIRQKDTGEVKSLSRSVMVYVDTATLKSASVPERWRQAYRQICPDLKEV